jgi:hypothetical protein
MIVWPTPHRDTTRKIGQRWRGSSFRNIATPTPDAMDGAGGGEGFDVRGWVR